MWSAKCGGILMSSVWIRELDEDVSGCNGLLDVPCSDRDLVGCLLRNLWSSSWSRAASSMATTTGNEIPFNNSSL